MRSVFVAVLTAATVLTATPAQAATLRQAAADAYGVRYGQVHPAIRLRRVNLEGVRVVHTFWTIGVQS